MFLQLKRNKDEVTFEEYSAEIEKIGYKFPGLYFKLKQCFEEFEKIYSKINIDDNNIPSSTKLKFMRHLLIDISLRQNISRTMKDEYDFETEIINRDAIKKSIDYIINDSQLKDREIGILIKRFGLDDGDGKTLEETGNIYGISGNRIAQIEAKAIRKLKHPSRKKHISIY